MGGAASPMGSVADISQGLDRFVEALEDGDIEGAVGHLGEAGLNAVKIDKIEKALKAASGPVLKTLGDMVPNTMSVYITRDLAGRGLAGKAIIQESIARGLKNGFDPGEAMAYGVFTATAKTALNTAAEGILGKGKTLTREALAALTPAQKALYKDAFTSELAQMGSGYLNDVRKEAQSRMVGVVAEEIFGETPED